MMQVTPVMPGHPMLRYNCYNLVLITCQHFTTWRPCAPRYTNLILNLTPHIYGA